MLRNCNFVRHLSVAGLSGVSVCLLVLISAWDAHAQQTELVDQSSGAITEVIVTARRREERLQDVPLAHGVEIKAEF